MRRGTWFHTCVRFVPIGCVLLTDALGDPAIEAVGLPVASNPLAGIADLPLPVRRLPAGVPFTRHGAPEADPTAATAGERIIYSNTHGRWGTAPGAGILMADDVSTTGPDGCQLSRFEFDVTGRVDAAEPGGPFTVTWAFYDTCPWALPATARAAHILHGTSGMETFDDDGPHTVVVSPPAGTTLPNHSWFGLTFSRDNAGPVVGAPAFEGHSQDLLDYPGFACSANLGDFPGRPHGSFNLRIWAADEASCPPVHIDYKSRRESGPVFNAGPEAWLTDDLTLVQGGPSGQPGCRMVGYHVTVRGAGMYDFEFRKSCDGGPIAGTQRQEFLGSRCADRPCELSYRVDPPVPLPAHVTFAARAGYPAAGVVVAGIVPSIGATDDTFAVKQLDGDCVLADFVHGQDDALSVTVLCEGPAEVGACCDMYLTECVEGPNAGEPCVTNVDCISPGHCEAVCRQTSLVNCPFPPRGSSRLVPEWEPGAACEPDPFPWVPQCGQAACCHEDAQCRLECDNLTRNECENLPPLGSRRTWQIGKVCGLSHRCPVIVDQWGPSGNCFQPRVGWGCDDPQCTEAVCNGYCQSLDWDLWLVARVRQDCDGVLVNNDSCSSGTPGLGANRIDCVYGAVAYVSEASEDGTDPPLCSAAPAGSEGCGPGALDCSQRVYGSTWFEFSASSDSVLLRACEWRTWSNEPPVIQVLVVRNRSGPAAGCGTLEPIAASSLLYDCWGGASVCVSGLIPQARYYVMVGAPDSAPDRDYVLTASWQSCPTRTADYDQSGRRDLRDFAMVQRCFRGDGDPPGCCGLLDLPPYDGLIGSREVKRVVQALSGP